MGREEVLANLWSCDFCNRQKLIIADDKDLPYDWVKEDILVFCSWSHRNDWNKEKDRGTNP